MLPPLELPVVGFGGRFSVSFPRGSQESGDYGCHGLGFATPGAKSLEAFFEDGAAFGVGVSEAAFEVVEVVGRTFEVREDGGLENGVEEAADGHFRLVSDAPGIGEFDNVDRPHAVKKVQPHRN